LCVVFLMSFCLSVHMWMDFEQFFRKCP
jgi:hypothetical protein